MNSSSLFQQAVQENSNREMDWLWLATQVQSEAEREYCFAKALHINPHSSAAQYGLRVLRQHRADSADEGIRSALRKLMPSLFNPAKANL